MCSYCLHVVIFSLCFPLSTPPNWLKQMVTHPEVVVSTVKGSFVELPIDCSKGICWVLSLSLKVCSNFALYE